MRKIFPGLSNTIIKLALKLLRIRKFSNKTFRQYNVVLLSVSRRFFLKMLFVFLAFVSLPVLLLSMPVYWITQSNIKAEVSKNNENMLIHMKDNLETMIEDTDSLNLVYSTNSEFISMLKYVLNDETHDSSYIRNSSLIKSFLVSMVASKPYIYSIYVYSDNPFANFLSNTDGFVKLDQYFDQSWFDSYLEHHGEKRSFWIESRSIQRYSFEHETEVITIFKEFFNENGIIALNISKDYLAKQMDELNLIVGQAFFVLNEHNEIILASQNGKEIINHATYRIWPESAQILNIDSIDYYIHYLESDTYAWKYVTATPLSSLYESAYQARSFMIWVFLASIVLCVGFALIITQRTCSHISTIITVLDYAEKGTEPLPNLPSSFLRNEYNGVIQNILAAYIEQSSLKAQVKENKYRMDILQFKALQTQMNPHFLFNTLKAIFWMSFKLTNSRNEVAQVVENLSNILHYSMDNQTRYVSFREEIVIAKDYISIEKTRYKEQFDVIWEFPEHINQYYSMKMLIQPIVENAIHHGLRQQAEKGSIKIKIVDRKNILLLYVTDNGIGMEREQVAKLNQELALRHEPPGHIGMYNCNRRICLAFGESYGVSVKSKKGYGTSVTVRLPKLTSLSGIMEI